MNFLKKIHDPFLESFFCFLTPVFLFAVIQKPLLKKQSHAFSHQASYPKYWNQENIFLQKQRTFIKEKTFYVRGDYKKALDGFLLILKEHKKHPLLEESYYYSGLCYRALGDDANASLCWDRLITQQTASFYEVLALIAKFRLVYEQCNLSLALRLSERLFAKVHFKKLPPDILKSFVCLLEFSNNTQRANILKKKISQSVDISFDKGFIDAKQWNSQKIFYSLQIGSFKNWRNAWKLKINLKKKNIDVHIVKESYKNQLFYKVRMKSEKSMQTINQCRYRLLKLKNIRSTVVSQNFSFHQLNH